MRIIKCDESGHGCLRAGKARYGPVEHRDKGHCRQFSEGGLANTSGEDWVFDIWGNYLDNLPRK